MKFLNIVSSGLLATAMMMTAPQAFAGDEDVPSDESNAEGEAPLINDTVTVTGYTFKDSFDFATELSAVPRKSKLLARWNLGICPAVSGIPADKAQMIADRIAMRAMAVGLKPGEPGCKPNIAIIISPDGNAATQAIYENDPKVFSLSGDPTVTTMGKFAFEDFLKTPRPVRWWHVSETKSEQGHEMSSGGQYFSRGGAANMPTVSTTSSSRLKGSYRQDLNHAVIVVDVALAQGVSLEALADYLAFVSLVQIDPDAETAGFDTVLNLFDETGVHDTSITGMSEWDVAYLKALYSAKRNAKTARQQEREIAETMGK
ncbi:hypothetical protein HY29_06280 [Hyphomonas beringensis]|uniref:Uncharacterized protein n=2 Tax=Hyphomonas beringensis TaxID=1280946 RepID=A0A062U2U8_9PROT|nr:hypothetical protein HY29_06280 [Hyphomonas beringensis]